MYVTSTTINIRTVPFPFPFDLFCLPPRSCNDYIIFTLDYSLLTCPSNYQERFKTQQLM